MTKIKIGQIGICHEHASAKMDSLRRLPEHFEIVGVVDDRGSTAARFAGEDVRPYEGLAWLSEEELFRTPGLDAVLVETANGDLVPTALRCMERNLAIHMDKPGGEDLALFRQLRQGCEARNLPYQIGYMFRNNPAMQWCLKAVGDGWLGEIFEVQASMSHNYGGEPYQAYIGKLNGGIMYNLGCHFIDFVVAMLGRPQGVTPFLKSGPGYPDAIKNNCLSILEYPHATVTLRACSLEVGGLNGRRLKICGTKGSVELCPLERFDGKPLTMRLTLGEAAGGYAPGVHDVDFEGRVDRYEEQLLELGACIRGTMANRFGWQHDVLVQEVVLAASGMRG